jgi:undecaprenyl-diphosphatase
MHGLLALDHTITFWLYQGNTTGIKKFLIELCASWFIYLLPLVLLYLFFFGSFKDKVNSSKVFVVVVFSWLAIARLVGDLLYKHYGFRDRPVAIVNIHELIFNQPTKSFPSDHATALMATALAFFYYKYPKLGWFFLVGGIISTIARVMAGFHWSGDIIGGWIAGTIGFGIIWLIDQPLTRFIEWFFSLFSRERYGR